MHHSIVATVTILVVLGAPTSVVMAAPEDGGIDRCVLANTAAQSLRREGKLGAARAELAVCVDAIRPALVRDDCNQRLDDLDRAQPTIVLDVRDSEGHDVSQVTVEVDGHPFAQQLNGIAVAVDPGEHTFTFELKGGPPKFTRRFVLREGEKGRHEQILLGTALPVTDRGSSLGLSRKEATPLGAERVASLAMLGVGLVGLGTGVAFLVEAKAKANDADAYCPGMVCSNDAALRMNRDARSAGNLATVAFAAGAACVTGAVVLWLTAKPSPSSPSAEVALVGSTLRVRGSW